LATKGKYTVSDDAAMAAMKHARALGHLHFKVPNAPKETKKGNKALDKMMERVGPRKNFK
jgi:hypothetical protein